MSFPQRGERKTCKTRLPVRDEMLASEKFPLETTKKGRWVKFLCNHEQKVKLYYWKEDTGAVTPSLP